VQRGCLLDGRTPPHCRRPTLLAGREAISGGIGGRHIAHVLLLEGHGQRTSLRNAACGLGKFVGPYRRVAVVACLIGRAETFGHLRLRMPYQVLLGFRECEWLRGATGQDQRLSGKPSLRRLDPEPRCAPKTVTGLDGIRWHAMLSSRMPLNGIVATLPLGKVLPQRPVVRKISPSIPPTWDALCRPPTSPLAERHANG
jgi:hypothetical protein